MLAKAFATEPDVFLLDEPTADVEPADWRVIMRLLRTCARRVRIAAALHIASAYGVPVGCDATPRLLQPC